MKAKAVVYSSDVLKNIDIQHLPSRALQNIQFFNNVSEAKRWLKSQS